MLQQSLPWGSQQNSLYFVMSWCADLRLIFLLASPFFFVSPSSPLISAELRVPGCVLLRGCHAALAPARSAPASRLYFKHLCSVCIQVSFGQNLSSVSLAKFFTETAESEMIVN